MNDASGLVALKFAISAALTGMFSLREASISFVIVAIGGLAIGAAVSWLFSIAIRRLASVTREGDPAPGVVLTLLIPFAAYLSAEHLHCSGILAAVAAGMMMNYVAITGSCSRDCSQSGNRQSLRGPQPPLYRSSVFASPPRLLQVVRTPFWFVPDVQAVPVLRLQPPATVTTLLASVATVVTLVLLLHDRREQADIAARTMLQVYLDVDPRVAFND